MDNFLVERPLFTPIFIDERLTEGECKTLINFYEKNQKLDMRGRIGVDTPSHSETERSVNVLDFIMIEDYDYTREEIDLRDSIVNKVIEVNNDSYKFELDEIDDIQFGKYGKGDFYTPHYDVARVEGSRHRKLSFTVILNDDFDGGKLNFFGFDNDYSDVKAGQIIIFPSWLLHEVQEVTNGNRYAIFGWMKGPRIK